MLSAIASFKGENKAFFINHLQIIQQLKMGFLDKITGKRVKGEVEYKETFAPGTLAKKPAKKPISQGPQDPVEKELEELFQKGILWLDGKEPAEKSHVFEDDFQPGLTTREQEIVTLQCKMYMRGVRINSTLLSSQDLDQLKKKTDAEGLGEDRFIAESLNVASVRDDKGDIEVVKKRIQGKKEGQ